MGLRGSRFAIAALSFKYQRNGILSSFRLPGAVVGQRVGGKGWREEETGSVCQPIYISDKIHA